VRCPHLCGGGAVKITVTNWDRYNPKRAQRTYTWLRLNNDILTGMDLYDCDADEKLIWVFILCECSKKNNGTINFNTKYCGSCLKIPPKKVSNALNLFTEIGLITIDTLSLPPALPLEPENTTPTNERTNETNETDGHAHPRPAALSAFVDKAYQNYPLKKGKAVGIQKLVIQMKSKQDCTDLVKAIDRYAQLCDEEKTEKRYIKHFGTFAGCWRDYLDDDVGKCDVAPPGQVDISEIMKGTR